MRRLLPHPLLSAILVVIWLLLVNQLNVGHLLLGMLLGWAVPLYTARFWPDPSQLSIDASASSAVSTKRKSGRFSGMIVPASARM